MIRRLIGYKERPTKVTPYDAVVSLVGLDARRIVIGYGASFYAVNLKNISCCSE